MKIIAIILLLSCIWDTVRATQTIEQGRREKGISFDNMAFHWHIFKGAGLAIGLNLLAIGFFVVYLRS